MRFACRWVLTVGLLMAFVGVCQAALTPGQKMGAEALIKQLSSEEFKVRESAVEKLAALGPDVIELIKPLLESDDEEIKLRAGMILKRIGQRHPTVERLPETETPAPEAGAFDRRIGSLITLKLVNADLATVLEKIAQQTGNKLLGLPKDWKGKPMTVDFDRTPYWKAIDHLCKEQGLMYHPDWRERNLRLVQAGSGIEITSYAGPVALKVAYAQKSCNYRSRSSSRMLSCSIRVFWEDRLNPGWFEPTRIERVTDGAGAQLEFVQPCTGTSSWVGRGRGTMRRNVPHSMFNVALKDYPEKLISLDEISGKLTMAFATGTQEIIIDDVMDADDQSGRVGGYELKVKDVQRRRKYVLLTATLTADGKPVERMRHGADQRYGVWLVDIDGKKYRGYISNVRVPHRAGDRARRGRIVGVGDGDGAKADGSKRITFSKIPEGMDFFKLVYVFPAKVTKQVYDFKFTEVAVP